MIKALGQLKNEKAPASSDILPGMLKVGKNNTDFVGMQKDLFQVAWESEQLPAGMGGCCPHPHNLERQPTYM